MLEIIISLLFSSCIHSEKIQAHLNYLSSLQAEQVYQDQNGIYFKVIDKENNCKIEFDPTLPIWNDSFFEQPHQENIQTIIRLYQEYCPQ